MNCEGCSRDVGDLKALKTHRKSCESYKSWAARAPSLTLSPPPEHHVYEGRKLPTMFA